MNSYIDTRSIDNKREILEQEIDDLQLKYRKANFEALKIEEKLIAKQQELKEFREFEQTVKLNQRITN